MIRLGGETWALFHFDKVYRLTGWDANGMCESNGNFSEQMLQTEITVHLHNFFFISILLSCYTIISPSRTFFDQPMRLQDWNDWRKSLLFDTESQFP